MASKGSQTHLKRRAAPRSWGVLRKSSTWIVKPQPGAHPINASLPILVIVRDMLKYADTNAEAKKIINAGEIKIDGRKVRDYKLPVGFMDLVSIDKTNEYFRVSYTQKGRVTLQKADQKNAGFKLCRIRGKKILRKGKTQLNLHDGRNIITDDKKYKVGDVVKLEIPEQKITDHYPLIENNMAYVTRGKHAGKIGVIAQTIPGKIESDPLVILKAQDGTEFKTRKDYTFVIGRDKPAISISE
ncbi:MAG: 30S ribosomal protein S4e [DPANN group archaeon]|nr:30S ribosomal protein S4e [DPANN group archaeon]